VPIIPFEVRPTDIVGLFVVQMKQIADERGTVREFFRKSDFDAAGVDAPERWLQVNITESRQGVIRGLHGESMTKYVSVASGSALGAYLDARQDSPSFGTVVTVELLPGTGVLVGRGICNGFQATASGITQYSYCFDREWAPDMAGTAVSVFDPELAIDWPIDIDRSDRSLLSAKDAELPTLKELYS
jgi:dTDP-4-dehydrorhamnose 3,5-epimerase